MRTLVFVVISLAIGCQGKQKENATGVGGSGSAGSAKVGSGPGSGSGSGSAKPVSTEIELPPVSGKPPAKTSGPHSPEQLEALSKLEFKGFTRDVRKIDKNFLNVKQRTATRPKIGITITILGCMDCLPMEHEKWKAKGDALKMLLPPELRDRADTTFDSGEIQIGGTKAIFTYQLGWFFGKDDQGNPEGTYANSYAIHYNDGKNQFRVVAEYVDDALGSKEDLARAVPRPQLERAALAFADAYAQQWGN